VNQRVLFDELAERERAWREFHRETPQVFAMFERFALQALGNGSRKIGARMVWERMRWETRVATDLPGEPWKLNDHHVPFAARLFMERHPAFAGCFETRDRAQKEPT
jgi:hypothetical protein